MKQKLDGGFGRYSEERMISEADEIIAPVHGRADHSMADIEDT